MDKCIIGGCTNRANNNIGIRLRRPDTSAIWAPNTNAFLCDKHADCGMRITIQMQPNNSRQIETIVGSEGSRPPRRATPQRIRHKWAERQQRKLKNCLY